MKSMEQQVRRRVVHALLVVAGVVLGAFVVQQVWPRSAAFFPPGLFLVVVIPTMVKALLVWRPAQTFRWLFPDQSVPTSIPLSGKEFKQQRLSAIVSLFMSAFLAGLWIKSLL